MTYDAAHQTMMPSASRDEVFARLRRARWFGALSEPLAYALFDAGELASCAPGTLYRADEPAQGLFALVDGTVHFDKIDQTGRRVLLHVAPPGYWFGEIASASGARTAVNVYAFTSIKVLRIAPEAVSKLLGVQTELAGALSVLMAERFAALIELVCAMRRPTALAQIAGRLAVIAQHCKASDSATDFVVLQMTQADLADMTGHARQTVNPAIKRLEHEGIIEIAHRQIKIIDTRGLEAFAYERRS
jgi:CRP-like cAMP-binding protein